MTKKRRRIFRYHLGLRKHDYSGNKLSYFAGYSAGKTSEVLKDFGFKNKIVACGLSGFTRVMVDQGYIGSESSLSLAGHTYGQIFKMDVYAHREDEEKVKVILRGCYCDILPNIQKEVEAQ